MAAAMSKRFYRAVAQALSETGATVATCAEVANRFRDADPDFDTLAFMELAAGPHWNDGTWALRAGGFLARFRPEHDGH